jgi:hypothetical protein
MVSLSIPDAEPEPDIRNYSHTHTQDHHRELEASHNPHPIVEVTTPTSETAPAVHFDDPPQPSDLDNVLSPGKAGGGALTLLHPIRTVTSTSTGANGVHHHHHHYHDGYEPSRDQLVDPIDPAIRSGILSHLPGGDDAPPSHAETKLREPGWGESFKVGVITDGEQPDVDRYRTRSSRRLTFA